MNYPSAQSSFRSSSVLSQYESRSLSPDNSRTSRLPGLFEFPEPKPPDDPRKQILCTDRVKQHAVTRDVSYRYDLPPARSPPDAHKELVEALSMEAPQVLPYPLPTDIQKLEEMMLQKDITGRFRSLITTPTEDSTPPLSEYEHQRFIEELDKAKIHPISHDHSQKHLSRSKPILIPPLTDLPKPIHLHNGKPPSKRETQLLASWLDYMVHTYLDNSTSKLTLEKLKTAQVIYTAAYKEIARQVSVNCSARGLLMDRIWNNTVEIFAQNENAFAWKLNEIKMNFKEIIAKTNKKYEEKLKVVTKKYADLNAEIRKETKRADENEKEAEELQIALTKEHKRVRDLEENLRFLSNSTYALQIEQEKKRLNEEFNKLRFKPPVEKRTIGNCTAEDQDLIESKMGGISAEFTLIRAVQKTVILQGYYDEKSRFHKKREFTRDEFGNLEIKDFAGQLVDEVPGYHKETNTEEDLGWVFLTNDQLDTIGRRTFTIPEAEIMQGLWIENYDEFMSEQRRRDMMTWIGLKSLCQGGHSLITGVVSCGTQLFGHEIKEEFALYDSDSPTSQHSGIENFQAVASSIRESKEVKQQLRALEECVGEEGNVARIGLELVRTARAADGLEGVKIPVKLLGSIGKIMMGSGLEGTKIEGKKPLFAPDQVCAECQTNPLSPLTSTAVQTDLGDISISSHRHTSPQSEESKNLLPIKASAKRTHPAVKVLSDLFQAVDSHVELRPAMHIKSLLKTINSFYSDRLTTLKETPSAKRASLVESLYEQMMTKYGLRNVAEKKLREVLTTAVVSREKSPRVRLFLDFAGMTEKYTTEDWNCYVTLCDVLVRTQVGTSILYDDTAVENYVSLERAEHVARTFFEGKLPVARVEEMLKGVSRLVISQPEGGSTSRVNIDKVGIDTFLSLLLDTYQAAKRHIQSTLQWPQNVTLTWKECEELLTRCIRWREQVPLIQKELTYFIDASEGEKVVRMDTVLSLLLDMNVYREGDAAL